MIVVDANVLIYWATEGPQTEAAESLYEKDPDWRTVPLWRYEFTNAMVLMVRKQVIAESKVIETISRAEAFLSPREHDVEQTASLRIALHYQVSGYDAQYVALAEHLKVTCVTADAPLVRKVPSHCSLLADFLK